VIQLIQGDCLSEMPKLESNSVDLVLADVPYGTTACKWDKIIPFEPMWKELKRVVKDKSAICLFGSEPFSSALRMSNINQYKYDWVWVKNRPANINCAKIRPMKYTEEIVVFAKKKENYYPQRVARHDSGKRRVLHGKSKNEVRIIRSGDHNSSKSDMIIDFSKLDELTVSPKNTLYFPRVNNTVHPTQKPVALLEYLIKTYTNEGDTVLDFTMGSGSTGVAAKNLNRKFIGIELDKTYFEIAKKRIESHEIKENQMELTL